MMDGRVAAIREALDDAGFVDVAIGSYCTKYASAFRTRLSIRISAHFIRMNPPSED